MRTINPSRKDIDSDAPLTGDVSRVVENIIIVLVTLEDKNPVWVVKLQVKIGKIGEILHLQ